MLELGSRVRRAILWWGSSWVPSDGNGSGCIAVRESARMMIKDLTYLVPQDVCAVIRDYETPVFL